MKYSEATKLIKGLSKKYSINNDKSVFELIYKCKPIAWVDKQGQFNFDFRRINISASKINELPYGHKLWVILAELAMTPLHKRAEHKWNVVVGEDNSKGSPLVIWVKADHSCHDYFLGGAEKNDLKDSETRFSDSEYAKLIKYIKTLPDGEYQAKVAEHGKTLVKGE